ncbi:MAG TPA: hypothetical protein VJZ00_24920 [Thermoanaerobaculia bacterium]|nr:hypothetical protein [Thermoanaerobaculia bacterium]
MRLLAILLFTATLAAEQPVSLHPVAPTSLTPIDLHIPVTCLVTQQNVTRTGNVIHVDIAVGGPCDLPSTLVHVVHLDPLPPGHYRVEVRTTTGASGIYASAKFVVRDGDAPRRAFIVHPFAIHAGNSAGLRMRIERTDGGEICAAGGCSGIHIRIGNTEVTRLTADGAAATFDAPSLAEGLYDVTFEQGETLASLPAAVYAFDEAEISVFERILFPVLADVPGANVSNWISEAVVANPKPWFVDDYNSVVPIVCVLGPCGARLSPRQHTRFSDGFYPNGVALLAPRPEAPVLEFALRVRDTSRAQEGFGTEIPVVREKNMLRNTAITLLDVPRDPRYRVKIRIYAFEPFFFPQDPRANVVVGTSEQLVHLVRECANCPEEPAYAQVDLAPGREGEFTTISIEPPQESFAWAFATVTNNVTQQVTIVTPNGEGGRP